MKVDLERMRTGLEGTFGGLFINDRPVCLTLEDPWNNNKTKMSCIPAGRYSCIPHNGTKYQNVWRLESVPGRSDVLIHWGNTILNTEGCILVGKSFSTYKNLPSITDSLVTIDLLRKILPPKFVLNITDQFSSTYGGGKKV